MTYPVHYVSITGAIGSGKSSLIEGLEHALAVEAPSDFQVIFAPEPVAQWQDDRGFDWLQAFYERPTQWALGLQFKILQGQIDMRDRMAASTRLLPLFVVTERSPWDGREIFMELQARDGVVSRQQADLYAWFSRKSGWNPDVCFYVRASDDQCVQRVQQRKRSSESSIDPAYIRRVCGLYNEKMAQTQDVIVADNSNDGLEHIQHGLVPQVLNTLKMMAVMSTLQYQPQQQPTRDVGLVCESVCS